MRLARILGAIGRGLISAGVIVLLFVAYQLWGTGLQNAQAQENLEDDFLEEIAAEEIATDAESLREQAQASQEDVQAGQIIAVPIPDESEAGTDGEAGDTSGVPAGGISAVGEPSATLVGFSQSQREAIVAKLYPEAGEAFARVVIPDINVDEISVEGVSVEDLRKGPGHYRTTPNPGQAGNAAIAGHRTTYGAPFHRVDELRPGASIFVTTVQGTFEYLVTENEAPDGSTRGHFIVSPSDTWVLGQDTGKNLLTLTACHPKYSARQRIIVQAELVGEPAPTIPRDEAADLGPVTIDSGSADERAAETDAATESDGDVVMSEEVAADDDPSVDAAGNPVDEPIDDATDGTDTSQDADEPTADEAADEPEAAGPEADDADVSLVSADDGGTTVADADPASDDIELTSSQTPFGDADDFGEGLNGDRTKIKPAIMWGIAGGAIWMAAWFIGHRVNRKWTLYGIGLAPFALVLWSAFVNIDQALPSY